MSYDINKDFMFAKKRKTGFYNHFHLLLSRYVTFKIRMNPD